MEDPKGKPEETQKPVEQPKQGIVSTQDNSAFNKEEEITIMPTMIDTSEDKVEKARDLSAIIPKNVVEQTSKDALSLTSKDKELKSDGSAVLATIDSNIDATPVANATLPEQIDVESRKAEQQKNKGRKRVDKKKKSMKKEHKMQNIGSIIAIIAILIIGGTAYYYFYGPKDSDFQVLNLTLEVGSSYPIRASSYVKPGVGKVVADYDYVINKDNVKIDEVGVYDYTVTHNGITKKGKITIVDTTPPTVTVRDRVVVREGTKIVPELFIEECKEEKGCSYSFQEQSKVESYKKPGTHVVYVVATDAYGNSTTSRVTLIVEREDLSKLYVKRTEFDIRSGYELTEKYELHYDDINGHVSLTENSLHIVVKKYSDQLIYEKAVSDFNGEAGYSFHDADKTITFTESIGIVGNNYTFPEDVDKYLTNNGFTEETPE